LVVNGVFHASIADDPVAAAMELRCRDALSMLPETLAAFPRTELALAPENLLGAPALRAFFQKRHGAIRENVDSQHVEATRLPSPLMNVVNEIALPGRGVVLTMGKGGVGKTTVAAAIAVELARRGHQVHLTTTDPAAHVHNTVGRGLAGLTVGRIDPEAETEAYRAEVMATAGAGLDAQGRALLEEDLRSPCTEEIAVFRAFAHAVDAGKDGYVVLDTAPTGHTILLLDAALAYHRELSRQAMEIPTAVRELLPRLRDPQFTRVLIVTLPEATPVHEAADLQDDLRRAQIQPFAWIINQSLSPLEVRDPVLVARQQCEGRYIHEVLDGLGQRVALVPWLTEAPVGVEKLQATLTFNLTLEAFTT
jgi:arsenite-transporting ATPase